MKGSALLVSTDDGQTWRAHSIPRADMNTLAGNAVFVLDADHAWSITDAHTIYRSTTAEQAGPSRLCPTTAVSNSA